MRCQVWSDTDGTPRVTPNVQGHYVEVLWPNLVIKLTLPEASALMDKLVKAAQEIIGREQEDQEITSRP